jgi:ribosomal protein L13
MAKDPTEVIRKAVLRMLPRNKLRDVSVRILVFYLSLSPIQMLYFICLLFRTLDFLAVIQ